MARVVVVVVAAAVVLVLVGSHDAACVRSSKVEYECLNPPFNVLEQSEASNM